MKMEQGDGLHITTDGRKFIILSRFTLKCIPLKYLVTVIFFSCFSVRQDVRQRNRVQANVYRFHVNEDNFEWAEYRLKILELIMVFLVLVLVVLLLVLSRQSKEQRQEQLERC